MKTHWMRAHGRVLPYANVVVRSWYTENALLAAIEEGTNQYVLIGAGFDSYVCRKPAEAKNLEIYEIDHPATQYLKIERMQSCGVLPNDMPNFISANLGEESLASALSRSNFDPNEPAFLSWLGVTMYLSREANMSTLESIASYCAPGSLLVFSYVHQSIIENLPTAEWAYVMDTLQQDTVLQRIADVAKVEFDPG